MSSQLSKPPWLMDKVCLGHETACGGGGGAQIAHNTFPNHLIIHDYLGRGDVGPNQRNPGLLSWNLGSKAMGPTGEPQVPGGP